MTWETVIGGALQGISNFANSFGNIIGGCLNSDTIEGLLALGALAVIISVLQGDTKIRMPKLPKLRRRDDDDDDDEYEYIRVRRQRR